MSQVSLLVLGMLDALESGSGYDVVAGLDRMKVSRWTAVKPGSVYHCLKRSVKDGFIEVAGTERNASYPEKTVYRMTQAGLAYLESLQRSALTLGYPDFFGFKTALKLNKRIPAQDISEYAKAAIAAVDGVIREMDEHLASIGPEDRARDSFFQDYDRLLLKAERAWLSTVAETYGRGVEPFGPPADA